VAAREEEEELEVDGAEAVEEREVTVKGKWVMWVEEKDWMKEARASTMSPKILEECSCMS